MIIGLIIFVLLLLVVGGLGGEGNEKMIIDFYFIIEYLCFDKELIEIERDLVKYELNCY